MEQKKFNSNIDAASVIEQKSKLDAEEEKRLKAKEEAKNNKGKWEFKPSLYLNTRLEGVAKSKTITIRLLPFDSKGGTPFAQAHVHSVKVNKEVSPSGWKKYMCPIGMGKGDKCPFCDVANKSRELRFSNDAQADKSIAKKYSDVEFSNKAKDYYIVRCIDRNNESDGPKFWRFAASKKNDGVFDKIYALFCARMKESIEQVFVESGVKYDSQTIQDIFAIKNKVGRISALRSCGCNVSDDFEAYSIYDLNNGKDLVVTVSCDAQGKTTYQISDKSFKTPLSNDFEQGMAWINDTQTWEDAYPVRSYDYMEIVLQGGVPIWSQDLKRFVDKTLNDKINEELKEQEIKDNLKEPSKDFSSFTIDTGYTKTQQAVINSSTQETSDKVYEEDLPF